MTSMKRLAGGAAFVALACAFASASYAQEITGALAGTVTDASGAPVAGAAVKVTNVPTGATLNATTNGDGFFTLRNLSVGGPYSVVVTAAGATKTVTVPSIGIGQPYSLSVVLPAEGAVSELVVTASRPVTAATVQTGPRSAFTAEDIQDSPSFSRDLRDLTRMNPLVTLDPSNQNAVIVAGQNSHFNTVYVDGVRQGDDFGLNAGGYPTQRSPFSVDIVQAFNFEVAPYDVRYGNFQGGILNVVTKSGTNDFHGGAFYEQDSDRWAGNKIGPEATKSAYGNRVVARHFKDTNKGVYLGGPIIPDKLFFFGDYEKYSGTGSASFVPGDVNGTNPVSGVTTADVNRVIDILKTKYNYDPLNYGGSGPVTDEKYFGKVDWFITDKQHLFVSYQQTKGTTYNVPNGSTSNRILNLASNDYVYEQDLKAWTADLVSHWTQNLTTELEYTHKTVKSPSTLNTDPFAEFMIQLPTGASIYLGPDISRQANDLGNTDVQYKARADYSWGNHVTTLGFEHEDLSEFDLFVQNATGAYTFNGNCGAGDVFTNLQNGTACALTYQNAFDNNPLTSASTVHNRTNTVFLQDEWRLTPELTLRAGLRYERYTTPDTPLLNPRFLTQYGYANTATIDGEDILMPRVGFNWQPDNTLVVTGGFGLFSGGSPGVYTYNSYQNTGNILGNSRFTCSTTVACTGPLTGVTGSSIPTSAQTAVTNSANLGTGNANALDPNFKPPSVWKASLSAVKTFNLTDYGFLGKPGEVLGDNWRVHGDVFASKTKEAVLFQDIWEMQNVIGTAPDGRPVFASPSTSTTIPNGTNVPGTPPSRYSNSLGRTSGSDILLSNTDKGHSFIWAVGFGKDWDNGFSFDYTYTRQNVKDVSAATSSTASSNYNNQVTADPNNPDLATSNYEIKYQHKLSVAFEHKFFGDNKTTLRLFAFERAGLPFSYAFCNTNSSTCASAAGVATNSGPTDSLFGQSATSTFHQLLYVPAGANGVVTATSDPLVTYGAGFNLAAFNSFLQQSGLSKYEGSIAPRNAFHSRDVSQIDLHLSQEFPAFFPGHAKGEFYLDVINLGNLIDHNWGVINQVAFPYALAPVVARNCQFAAAACAAGVGNFYQYDTLRFTSPNTQGTVQTPASPPVPTWVIKAGIRYKF